MNGSPEAVPVSGIARTVDGHAELSLTLRYHDVPQDWAERLRAQDFDYRLRGKVERGATFDLAGTRRWDQVTIEKREDTKANLMKLDSIDIKTQALPLLSDGSTSDSSYIYLWRYGDEFDKQASRLVYTSLNPAANNRIFTASSRP